MKFAELCRHVNTDDLLACLLRAISELSDLMHNYYSIFNWHITKERSDEGLTHDFSKVKKCIDEFRQEALWPRIQNKFSQFLNNSDFSHLKIDRFLQVFHALNMLCELGEEFSDSDSHQLRGSLRATSIAYFKNYHKDTLENLRSMMENESWQRLDSSCFSLSDVPQFDQSTNYRRNTSSERVDNYIKQVRMFLHAEDTDQNPFKIAFEQGHFQLNDPEHDENRNKHVDSSDSEDEDDDNSDDSDDEDVKLAQEQQKKKLVEQQKKRGGPIFTNISMSMIKRMGTYVQAIEVLQQINVEIFEAFVSLYKFYVYTVYSMFGEVQESPAPNDEMRVIYPETEATTPDYLKDFFREVRDTLNKYNYDKFFMIARHSSILQPQLKSAKSAYGFYERSVAAESLSFMQNAIATVAQSRLVHLVPKSKVSLVEKFVNDMQRITTQIQTVIYERVAKVLFKHKYDDKVPKKLDIQNPQLSSNSPYINDIIRDFGEFKKIMRPLEEHEHIPSTSTDMLWTVVIKGVMENIVEGLSKIKSCNDFGRALLQLDLRSLTSKLGDLVPNSARDSKGQIPYVYLVRNYIEGTFNDSAQYMLEWVRDNKDNYTIEQVKNILQISPLSKLGRKERNELIAQIDLMYKNARDAKAAASRQSADIRQSMDVSSPALPRHSLDVQPTAKATSISPRSSMDTGPSTGTEPTGGMKKSNSMWNGFSNLNNLLQNATGTNPKSNETNSSNPPRQSIDLPSSSTGDGDTTGGELKKSNSLWNKLNVGGLNVGANSLNINTLKWGQKTDQHK